VVIKLREDPALGQRKAQLERQRLPRPERTLSGKHRLRLSATRMVVSETRRVVYRAEIVAACRDHTTQEGRSLPKPDHRGLSL
jgi:hypothetical protein